MNATKKCIVALVIAASMVALVPSAQCAGLDGFFESYTSLYRNSVWAGPPSYYPANLYTRPVVVALPCYHDTYYPPYYYAPPITTIGW